MKGEKEEKAGLGNSLKLIHTKIHKMPVKIKPTNSPMSLEK